MTVNVVDFGATPDGSADSTQAFHDAIAATFVPQAKFGPQQTAGDVFVPPGAYKVGSINATDLQGLRLRCIPGTVGLYADQQSTPMPVLDLAGSSNCEVEGLILAGQQYLNAAAPAVMPTCGFLIADTAPGGRSTKNTIRKCGTVGWFLHAAMLLRGATDHLITDTALQSQNPLTHALYAGAVNPWNTPSHQPLAPQWTKQPCGNLTFLHAELHAVFSQPSKTHTTRFWDCDAIRFVGGLSDNTGGPAPDDGPGHVIINGEVYGLVYQGLQFYSEGGAAAKCIIDNQGVLVRPSLRVCNVTRHNATVGPVIVGNAPVNPILETY